MIFDIAIIVPTDNADTFAAATGPVGGEPVGFPQAGIAETMTSSPVEDPASDKSLRRLSGNSGHAARPPSALSFSALI
jgi:hypothetical protein